MPAVGALLALSAALAAGLLREGVRRHFPRPTRARAAADRCPGDRQPSRSTAMFFLAGAVPRGRGRCPDTFIDALAPVTECSCLVVAACRGRRRLDVADDRAGRGEPQLVQRPSGVRPHRARQASARGVRRFTGGPRGRNATLGPAWDLRVSRREPGDAVHGRRASRSRSGGSSAQPAFHAREVERHAARRAPRGRRVFHCRNLRDVVVGRRCTRRSRVVVGLRGRARLKLRLQSLDDPRGTSTLASSARSWRC